MFFHEKSEHPDNKVSDDKHFTCNQCSSFLGKAELDVSGFTHCRKGQFDLQYLHVTSNLLFVPTVLFWTGCTNYLLAYDWFIKNFELDGLPS